MVEIPKCGICGVTGGCPCHPGMVYPAPESERAKADSSAPCSPGTTGLSTGLAENRAATEGRKKIGSRGALDGGSRAIRGVSSSGNSVGEESVYNASARNGTAAKNVCRHCGKPIELAEAPVWVHKNPADWKGERKGHYAERENDFADAEQVKQRLRQRRSRELAKND